jgi:glycosyltransferase involved in cell wall biosynthesis
VQNTLNKSENEIRICHIIVALDDLGGAERMLARLLNVNPESNDKKLVLVLCRAGSLGDQLRSKGILVHELNMKSFLDIPHIHIQLKKVISSFKPDVVQTWMYHADLLGSLAAFFSGYKNIVWGIRRTSLSLSDKKSTFLVMKLCALLSYWIPKKIISVAEAGKHAHVSAGYSESRMVVIPNGFDFVNLTATTAQRTALRKECNFLDDELVVGCVGRFHHAKGQDNFVEAAAIVALSHENVKFLMVGKDCSIHNTILMGWINKHNLQDRFALLGERHDVPVCLAAMDIFCMPSRTEGFPNGLGEAMAMGLPCVATDVGDTAFLAGGTVTLVPAQDEQALAFGLLEVIALPEEQRKNIGKRSKERVMTEFSIEKAYERFNAVYQDIVFQSDNGLCEFK